MTSSNVNIFRVIRPLCGEFTSHKGQWRGALMFSLICAWINGWVNNGEAGNLRRHCAHYDVIVIITLSAPSVGVGQEVVSAPLDVDTDSSVTKCNRTLSLPTDLASTLMAIYTCPNGTPGQYIYIASDTGPLTIYTVNILAHNLAFSKSAWKVPSDSDNDASIAVDCKFGFGMMPLTQLTQTAEDNHPFWAVDLGGVYAIQEISFAPTENSK